MGLVRVALALAVVLSHLPPAPFHFIGGGVAVQAFFIISGFYMALVLSGKYASTSLFYSNRLLRLLPGYFAMMVVAAIVFFGLNASATMSPELVQTAYRIPAVAGLFGVENLIILGQELFYWFKLEPNGTLALDLLNRPETDAEAASWRALLVPQSWSLSMELVFYAFAPLLVRARTQTLVALAAASIALRFAGHLLPVDYSLWQGRLFPTALFLFIFGILGHRMLPLTMRMPKALGWIANAVLLGAIVTLPLVPLENELSRWSVYLVVALTMPFVFHAFKDIAADRWLGDLSYPIYLSHLTIVGLVLTFEPPYAFWVAIAGTFALSTALLLFVDHPVDRWRQRRAHGRALIGLEQPASP